MIPDPMENLQGYALYRHVMDNKGGGGSYHHFNGYRFSLQNLVKGLYGESESKTMDAAHAPKAWADGKYQEVLDYCMHDCVLTANVFFDAPQSKFEAVGFNGQRSKKHQIKVNW